MAQVTHVVGARPNFPKAAPVIRGLAGLGIAQRLVHTGQHYDDAMSAVFFRELDLPEADANLGIGSGSHARQTAAAMVALEEDFTATAPDLVMVYGDVNSTMAAALVAAKHHIPLAHVEAGLRSFDRGMPEEVNRVVVDQLSDLLFATSPEAIGNLADEGIDVGRVHLVGNPMIDTLLGYLTTLRDDAPLPLDAPDPFGIVTLHRPANVDDPAALGRISSALAEILDRISLVMPVHPRTAEGLRATGLLDHPCLMAVDPLPYTQFVQLVRRCALVITDSGGIQEETTVMGVPCLTLRPNTERPVTITHGTNRLVRPESLLLEARGVLDGVDRDQIGDGPPLWDGRAGERIASVVRQFLMS